MPVIYLSNQDTDLFITGGIFKLSQTGGCRPHGNSRSEWSFSQKMTEDNIWRLNASFQDHVAKIHHPVSIFAKLQWEQVGNFFFFKLFTPCLWADPHLNVFVILKNLLNGFVQKPPLDSAPMMLLSARHQVQSTTFVLCHQLPLLLGIIASPWLDASIF